MFPQEYKHKLLAHFDQLELRLLLYPHVIGVGFGWKEINSKISNIPALRVYVHEKIPRRLLHRMDVIPSEVGGLPTDILSVKIGTSISGNNMAKLSVPEAGSTITNLKAVIGSSASEDKGSGLGTLGFFATQKTAHNGRVLILVSNRHVLLAHGAQRGDLIYQPNFRYASGQYYFDREKLNPIAEILDEGIEGNYIYQYPDENRREYFIDCSTARMLTLDPDHIRTSRTHPGKALFKGVARVHPFDVFAGRELHVYKLGHTTNGIAGKVVDVKAPVLVAEDKHRRENNLVIRAEEPGRGIAKDFAEESDSGTLIVDELNRAVGLLWGKSLRNNREAFACHIHPVLDYLNVSPLPYNVAPQSVKG